MIFKGSAITVNHGWIDIQDRQEKHRANHSLCSAQHMHRKTNTGVCHSSTILILVEITKQTIQSTSIVDTNNMTAQNINLLLRLLKQLRCCLGQNTLDRAQPSQIQVTMRETYIVDKRYQLAVLVRYDCTTNRIP